MAEDLPIDIQSGKLLDWLISRRHCNKDWQKNVLVIREKMKSAILDMPESKEIVELLGGSYINYFHCLRIIEILRETEKDTKNFLGYYSSQRMKDWQEIESLYKKDNIHLAESAQILQRLAQYEIPSLKKQIVKADQSIADSIRKEKEYDKQAEDGKKAYARELTRMGIQGKSLRAELLELAGDLPSFFDDITKQVIDLKDARQFYIDFRAYMNQKKDLPPVVPLLGELIISGPSMTAYQWKYKQIPTIIERPSFDLLLHLDKEEKDDDEIDFGDDEINFGDDEINFDLDDGIQIEVLADDSGAVGELVARGDDALGILENSETQKILKMELEELIAFLSMRIEDENREVGADLFIRAYEKRPSNISISTSILSKYEASIISILNQLNDQQKLHLFNIRSSPQYVEKIVAELEVKRGLEAKYKKMKALMVEKQIEGKKNAVTCSEELKNVVANTKKLQKQIEEEISKKYKGRKVNIMGAINAALAST